MLKGTLSRHFGLKKELTMSNYAFLFIFEVTDVAQQKKAYRVLEQICGADSESSKMFMVSHLKELQEILLKTLASSSSASKTVSTASVVKHELDLFFQRID